MRADVCHFEPNNSFTVTHSHAHLSNKKEGECVRVACVESACECVPFQTHLTLLSRYAHFTVTRTSAARKKASVRANVHHLETFRILLLFYYHFTLAVLSLDCHFTLTLLSCVPQQPEIRRVRACYTPSSTPHTADSPSSCKVRVKWE